MGVGRGVGRLPRRATRGEATYWRRRCRRREARRRRSREEDDREEGQEGEEEEEDEEDRGWSLSEAGQGAAPADDVWSAPAPGVGAAGGHGGAAELAWAPSGDEEATQTLQKLRVWKRRH